LIDQISPWVSTGLQLVAKGMNVKARARAIPEARAGVRAGVEARVLGLRFGECGTKARREDGVGQSERKFGRREKKYASKEAIVVHECREESNRGLNKSQTKWRRNWCGTC